MRVHGVTGGGEIRLHVDETGNPQGQPILFIHGFSQCRLAWTAQLYSDLAEDFRLVAMDIRGHGSSDKPRDAYGDSRLWADDVHAVIEELELERPILVGWSYGGLIIMDYVRFYGDERLGGINLVGAVTKIGTPEATARLGADFLAMVPGFFAQDVEESVHTLDAFIRLCTHEPLPPTKHHLALGYNVIVPPAVRQGLFSRTLTNDDLLPTLMTPVLITHGEEDQIVLATAAEEHSQRIPRARLSLYPDVGHAPFVEAPARFNAELRAFATGQ